MRMLSNQISERQRREEKAFNDALTSLADAVMGIPETPDADVLSQAEDALELILKYYGIKDVEIADNENAEYDHLEEFVEAKTRSTGVMFRAVRLEDGWYKDAMGAMLGFTDKGVPVALLPRRRGGYCYRNPETGKVSKVTKAFAGQLQLSALCFYRPLPQRKLTLRDLVRFMSRSLDASDYGMIIGVSLIAVLLGAMIPRITQIVFGPLIGNSEWSLIGPIAVLLVGFTFAQIVFEAAKSVILSRLWKRIDLSTNAALMMRILSLPAPFFKGYSPGNLHARIKAVGQVITVVQYVVFQTGITSLFSLVYIVQIFMIAPPLTLPAVLTILATAALTVVSTLIQVRIARETLKLERECEGMKYGFLQGIRKIKLTGSEKRVFALWADNFQKQIRLTYNPPLVARLVPTLTTAISLIGGLAFFVCAYYGQVSVADYIAFLSAFGMVSAAFSGLSKAASKIASIKPQLEQAEPVLSAMPETQEDKPVVDNIDGSFELDDVTFSYGEGMPNIMKGLSVKVPARQFTALVGKSGCGKTTLLRLLLGFERPNSGVVSYGDYDIAQYDIKSIRRNIGSVLQDGKLLGGTVFANIALASPHLTMQEAWEAAEMAGIADDIRDMPMGMFTEIAEGNGSISGGQRQRLLVARAIASKPKILLLDEATCALDNITQKKLSDALGQLDCTRLVVAHRLSTIKECDRILVMDDGCIIEDGAYDELVAKGGYFAELVARQQL